ncbi:hypothetical protein B9Z55_009363 [Caenorhabditis nigoni]|uniref:Uncharacterized protein n=1 Tax=Caenorhabditis nigoni TaxID=1611254 RepID=A0A2G5URT0_9PELO|nr:hypothetical protein B9Z55_009363 [Caenorhabditis nigoni]
MNIRPEMREKWGTKGPEANESTLYCLQICVAVFAAAGKKSARVLRIDPALSRFVSVFVFAGQLYLRHQNV